MSKLEDAAKTLRSTKKIPFDGKQWTPGKLIIHLAKEVRRLRKNQCVPSMRCLFEYEDYLESVYGSDSGNQPFLMSHRED